MSDKLFGDIPTTSEDAFGAASRTSTLARVGFKPKRGHAPLDVQAARLRRLGAWLAEREFDEVCAASERRALASFAQFETATSEAW